MIPIPAFFSKNLYFLIAIGILLAGVGVLSKVALSQSKEIGKLEAANKEITDDRDLKVAIIKTKEQENALLTESNATMIKELRVSKETYALAVESFRSDMAAAQAAASAARRQRDVAYKTPECKSFNDINIAAACPAVAASMRERASRMSAP